METKKKDQTPEERQRKKAFWIGFAIAFAVSIPLAVGSFFLIRSGYIPDEYEANRWRIWTDTFTLPGVLYILVYLLVKVSDFGAFDAIVYSVRLLFVTIFSPVTKNSKLPRNYRDYRLMRQSKKRTSAAFLLIIGLIYMAVMAVFLIIWFSSRSPA